MLKKFIAIKNIGKFVDCKPYGDVEFKQLTLISGGNGHGKSTICNILRSLQSGQGSYITGRTTLGTNGGPPSVQVLTDSGKRVFNENQWDSIYKDLAIYDSEFVNSNVHSGETVNHSHKKNLYRVVVGEEGVRLAEEIDRLSDTIKTANEAIRIRRREIELIAGAGTTAEEFSTLPLVDDVDLKIEELSLRLRQVERAAKILEYPLPTSIALPEFPGGFDGFRDLMSFAISDVSRDAESIVKSHVARHSVLLSEDWIADGLAMTQGDNCPFCGQSLQAIVLLDSYRTYFSDAYKALKIRIEDAMENIDNIFGVQTADKIKSIAKLNDTAVQCWSELLDLTLNECPLSELGAFFQTARFVLYGYLQQKLAAPLEEVQLGPDFDAAMAQHDALSLSVRSYNESIAVISEQVSVKKAGLSTANSSSLKNEIVRLKVCKARHSAEGLSAVSAFQAAMDSKLRAERAKSDIKKQLEIYTSGVFESYQSRLNQILRAFGAGFVIVETKSGYAGGTAHSSYAISINNVSVQLGDSSHSPEKPHFGNTLSSGDKSTLALAFFLARLQQDPTLSKKVVVFDDPFTSMDYARRASTQRMIGEIARSAKQVIVLSHDPNFLRLIYDDAEGSSLRCLELQEVRIDSIRDVRIREWDILKATQGRYRELYDIVHGFVQYNPVDPNQVATAIRPLLEIYLRVKYPIAFPEGKWLGDLIQSIRKCDSSSPLFAVRSRLAELEEINDFSKQFHHSPNSTAQGTSIDQTELRTYSMRTLDFIASF